MIVLKYTYDKSITSTFSFSFNNGFAPTTTEETSGNLVTVTVESDTVFTDISIPTASEAGLVAVHYMDLSNVSKTALLFERCVNLTDVTLNNSTTKLTDISSTFYFYADNPHKNPINISFVNCNLSAIPDNLAINFINAEYKNIPSLTFDNCVLSNGMTMRKIINSFKKETKLIFKNCTTAPSTSFERMFYGTGRTEVDLSGIDFTNVTSTYLMFSNSQIRKLTLPKGDFYNLTDISMMFEGAYYIEEVDISDFHIMNPVNITNMFVNCRSLKKVNLSGININKPISFNELCGGTSVCEWFDISNLKAIPSSTTNFWKSQAVVENVGMLYCPANVINTIAPLLVGSGRTCNIYYHDAKLEDLTVDSRFNYIYCEEYYGDVVSTPDDLELLTFTADNQNITDVLDLTTGIVTKNVGRHKVTDISLLRDEGYDANSDLYCIAYLWNNCPNIVHRGNSTLAWNSIQGTKTWDYGIDGMFSHGMGAKFQFRLKGSTRGITSSDEARQYLIDNGLELLYEQTPVETQLDINPLKSYRNGSIQTSSQQLAPTLKTTLPVSNKFTTTNLTSGSTYNVYFDGTATKLDAGGTIITNPVSPCEVECGGTTLTIEGTDIQNVRVIETTVKNEVGSVCGTTDVELSRVKTKCGIYNMFDDYTQGSHNTQWAKDYQCTSTRDDTTVKIVGKGSLNYAGYSLVESLPFGTYKLHYKVKVSTIGDKYKVALSSNPNGTPQDAHVPVTDVTSTALVEEQTFVFYKKWITHMLFYTYTNGQEIEYYDISLIKLSDNDITGTDTSNINHSQVTSDLEQPIKLRSLGTTYDSYNPVTGELIKRIGVSETDGSYSVLSSPVVENISMGKTIENIFNFEEEWINRGLNTSNAWQLTNDGDGIYTLKALQANATARVWFSLLDAEQTVGEELTTIIEVFKNTSNKSIPYWSQIRPEDGTGTDFTFNAGETGVKIQYGKFTATGRAIDFQNIGKDSEFQFRVTIVRGLYPNIKEGFGTRKIIQVPPHLYTNGQVKVYSDSEVYPTTILNGQSTNNYEINGLNTSNNYTIRYEGECESINLANKSNTQGHNALVKAGTTSGNLTFVNDNGYINNVLLVQNDVREQEINYFTGLQTVEISQLQISPSGVQNMFIQNTLNDFEKIGGHGLITENGYLELSHSSANQSGVFRTKETYTLKPKASILIRIVGTGYSTGTYQLITYIGDGKFVNQDQYCSNHTSLESIAKEISKNGYCDLILTNVHTESFTGQLTLASYFNQWIISHVAICDENVDYIEPTIIDLPQPVQINSLLDGTHDTYNPITGEYVQNVGYFVLDDTITWKMYDKDFYYTDGFDHNEKFIIYHKNLKMKTSTQLWNGNSGFVVGGLNAVRVVGLQSKDEFLEYMKQYPLQIIYGRKEPITTQLTPINIPTFEGGIVQLITTDGKVFPMVEYSMPTNNRYDTSSWEAGKVYTQRNMTEAYFNESTTPMIPTETMTLTTDHISSGSIILNDNGNGLIVLKGNYTGRDIPYFTGIRSVEAIEVETTPSPDQPLFGKGGRK